MNFIRKDGIFRLAKFDAKTLRKESSVQIGFEPTTRSIPSSGLHLETDRDFDFQISAVRSVHNTVHLALFST